MGLIRLPPEIVVDDIVLRRPDPEQASAVVEAVNDSLAHLQPWMAWAQRPTVFEATALRLAVAAAAFDAAADAAWTIFDGASGEVIGGCGLHDRIGGGGRDIGYWVRAGWTGGGVATRAAAALTWVGFDVLALDRIEIRCDAANARSAAVPRRLGYSCVGTFEGFCGAPSDSGKTMVWAVNSNDWPTPQWPGTSPLQS